MATIVRHNIRNKLYILIGVGFGSSNRVPPSAMLPTASSMTSEAELVAVTDASGEISQGSARNYMLSAMARTNAFTSTLGPSPKLECAVALHSASTVRGVLSKEKPFSRVKYLA